MARHIMSAAPFDTLKYAEALKAAGVPDAQAKGQAQALVLALWEGDLATRADSARLRAELKTDIAELRMVAKADIAELRAELKTDIAELKAEIQAMINRLLLTLISIIIGSMVAMTAIYAAIVKLL
jgi:hypothetical protein